MELFSHNNSLTSTLDCIIEIDGSPITEIDELAGHFDSVEVDVSRNRASMCRVTFATTRLESGNWAVADSDLMRPWNQLEVKILLDNQEVELFSGYIIKVSIGFSGDTHNVTATCQDKSVLMDREHIIRVWGDEDEPVTDGDIVSEIADKYQLEVQAEAGITHSQLNQNDTDIRFLYKLARANGYEMRISEACLYFGQFHLDGEPQQAIMVYAGEDSNCIDFLLTDDGYKPDSVLVDIYTDQDFEHQELFPKQRRLGSEDCETLSRNSGSFNWKVRLHGLPSETALAIAQGKAEENAWKISATGSLNGILYGAALEAGKTVDVQGIGSAYSGTYYVDSVTHRIDQTGYKQQFKILRNARK